MPEPTVKWQDVRFHCHNRSKYSTREIGCHLQACKKHSPIPYIILISPFRNIITEHFKLLTFPEDNCSNWENLLKHPMSLDTGLLYAGYRYPISQRRCTELIRHFSISKKEKRPQPNSSCGKNPDESESDRQFEFGSFLPSGK